MLGQLRGILRKVVLRWERAVVRLGRRQRGLESLEAVEVLWDELVDLDDVVDVAHLVVHGWLVGSVPPYAIHCSQGQGSCRSGIDLAHACLQKGGKDSEADLEPARL